MLTPTQNSCMMQHFDPPQPPTSPQDKWTALCSNLIDESKEIKLGFKIDPVTHLICKLAQLENCVSSNKKNCHWLKNSRFSYYFLQHVIA
jgi:hypothetical protein